MATGNIKEMRLKRENIWPVEEKVAGKCAGNVALYSEMELLK